MKIRNCWPALENRTEQVLSELRLASAQALKLRESLLGSQQKLTLMYQEYHAQCMETGSSSGMADALNQRNFMNQLLLLRQRVEQDLARSKQNLALLEQRTLRAEADKMKVQTMMKIDQQAVEHHRRKREQGQLDELGVLQFNRATAR